MTEKKILEKDYAINKVHDYDSPPKSSDATNCIMRVKFDVNKKLPFSPFEFDNDKIPLRIKPHD